MGVKKKGIVPKWIKKTDIKKTEELTEKLRQWREKVGAKMMEPNPDYAPSVKAYEFCKY
jgi:hypothetical protein